MNEGYHIVKGTENAVHQRHKQNKQSADDRPHFLLFSAALFLFGRRIGRGFLLFAEIPAAFHQQSDEDQQAHGQHGGLCNPGTDEIVVHKLEENPCSIGNAHRPGQIPVCFHHSHRGIKDGTANPSEKQKQNKSRRENACISRSAANETHAQNRQEAAKDGAYRFQPVFPESARQRVQHKAGRTDSQGIILRQHRLVFRYDAGKHIHKQIFRAQKQERKHPHQSSRIQIRAYGFFMKVRAPCDPGHDRPHFKSPPYPSSHHQAYSPMHRKSCRQSR